MILTPLDKALAINNDFGQAIEPGGIPSPGPVNYRGAIAEIGAGQEIARLFFQAFGSSKTIVKTMSAYGKGCSNAIYDNNGDKTPFISESRLMKMINHDYELLLSRDLHPGEKPKAQKLRYFAFANTVDLSGDKNHGWAGVRVQTSGCSLKSNDSVGRDPVLEYRIHFEVLAKDKVAKMRIVGTLGINLIYGGLLHGSMKAFEPHQLVSTLMESIEAAELRIDTIAVQKLEVRIDKSKPDGKKLVFATVENEMHGKMSRDMCIELVKSSNVHCASFKDSQSAAIYSHHAFREGTPLVLTRSACLTKNLPLEVEMLNVAKTAFAIDLGGKIKHSDIAGAIHMPILATLPPKRDQSKLHVYIERDNEPPDNKTRRMTLIGEVLTNKLAERVERIVKSGNIALLSEFSASSEILKFLRSRTKLRKSPGDSVRDIALVFRADQFVEALINIGERVKDREPLEFIGSIIRRQARFYIYPCSWNRILKGKTRYKTDIKKAFNDLTLKENATHGEYIVTLETLKTSLLPKYKHLIQYMANEMCISGLKATNDKFIDMAIRSDIDA